MFFQWRIRLFRGWILVFSWVFSWSRSQIWAGTKLLWTKGDRHRKWRERHLQEEKYNVFSRGFSRKARAPIKDSDQPLFFFPLTLTIFHQKDLTKITLAVVLFVFFSTENLKVVYEEKSGGSLFHLLRCFLFCLVSLTSPGLMHFLHKDRIPSTQWNFSGKYASLLSLAVFGLSSLGYLLRAVFFGLSSSGYLLRAVFFGLFVKHSTVVLQYILGI